MCTECVLSIACRNSWLYCDHWVYGFHCSRSRREIHCSLDDESFLTEIEEGVSVFFWQIDMLLQYAPHSFPYLEEEEIRVQDVRFKIPGLTQVTASLFPEYSRKKREIILEIDFSCGNAFFSQILNPSSLNRDHEMWKYSLWKNFIWSIKSESNITKNVENR